MNVIRTEIPDVLILEPTVFGDSRGFFFESFNAKTFAQDTGLAVDFVQDNHSRSTKGVLRGLHYQIQQPQGKLVRVIGGDVFDVAVDLRQSSPTFKRWVGVRLTDENKRLFWIPPGFGHGFLVLSERADFLYKTTAYYSQPHDRSLRWDDPTIGVQWPLNELGGMPPSLSEKDMKAKLLGEADLFE
jgi:dTDP-4-dehydrorhamnose 3,5-epimerase